MLETAFAALAAAFAAAAAAFAAAAAAFAAAAAALAAAAAAFAASACFRNRCLLQDYLQPQELHKRGAARASWQKAGKVVEK